MHAGISPLLEVRVTWGEYCSFPTVTVRRNEKVCGFAQGNSEELAIEWKPISPTASSMGQALSKYYKPMDKKKTEKITPPPLILVAKQGLGSQMDFWIYTLVSFTVAVLGVFPDSSWLQPT